MTLTVNGHSANESVAVISNTLLSFFALKETKNQFKELNLLHVYTLEPLISIKALISN